MNAGKLRVDERLVARGLFRSRSRARDAVLRGTVEVGGIAATKPGTPTAFGSDISANGPAQNYVGASRVFGIDVGHGQFDAKLAGDPRVSAIEGLSARDLTLADLGGQVPDFLVSDVSSSRSSSPCRQLSHFFAQFCRC